MQYVYILKSLKFPEQEYIGTTLSIEQRLDQHNNGESKHTNKFRPWEMVWYCAFNNKQAAFDFEKYLKSHSGRAFTKKRLLK